MSGLCPSLPLSGSIHLLLWTVALCGLWDFYNYSLLKGRGSAVFSFEFLVLTSDVMHRMFSIEGDDRLGRCLFQCNLKGD